MSAKDNISIEVTQRSEFSCSYIMKSGNYYSLNSINYKFEATVSGSNENGSGILISFEEFKRLLKEMLPDGYFIYNSRDIKQQALCREFQSCGIPTKGFKFEICAERLLEELSLILMKDLEQKYEYVTLKETKLRENNNSYVSWNQEVK